MTSWSFLSSGVGVGPAGEGSASVCPPKLPTVRAPGSSVKSLVPQVLPLRRPDPCSGVLEWWCPDCNRIFALLQGFRIHRGKVHGPRANGGPKQRVLGF